MSASDHLSVDQFHPDEIAHLASRDFPGRIGDIEFAPGGESDRRVRDIMSTAVTEGIREPLRVRHGGHRYLDDGHHRYVAAKRLGIPVSVEGYYQ